MQLRPGVEAHAARQPLALALGARQAVHLLIGAHLQPVLQPAQEHVGRIQLGHRVGRQQLAPDQQRQRLAQRAVLQPPVLAAADQLERLHDELDLADAAVTELDVVGELAALHFALDQRLHLAQRFEHAEVEIAPIDERLHERCETVRA